MSRFTPCDLCGTPDPQFLMTARGLDGPLVQCTACGLRYVGRRNSALAFGAAPASETADKVRAANRNFRPLPLEEEHRLARLNAQWRLDLIRKIKPSGSLLEIGCGRGDFLKEAKQYFDVSGVEPNPDLAEFASRIAPVYRDVIERTAASELDVVASFHVIEHVDSPSSFVRAAAERLKRGGLLAIETPNIDSAPFRLLRSRWRQFIPEHYFFFNPDNLARLLSDCGLQIASIGSVGKYASLSLVMNRLGRYWPWLPDVNGLSGLTFRVNPLDIMLALAMKN